MKKLILVAVLGVAVVATAAVSSPKAGVPAEPQVDLQQVNARIDARLHAVLGDLIAERR